LREQRVKDHERLQELLGADYDVGGTRKLHVRSERGKTLGTFDPRAGVVEGFAEVSFFGFDRTPHAQLRTLGEEKVREQLDAIDTRGFQVDFDAGTVDPLGLSELTNRENGPDFLYVVDLRKEVDGVEDAAAVLGELAEEEWRFEVREEEL
jgi:hypothetical protein